MRTLAVTVAYDGTDWAGFQRQSTCPTIQGALEEALTEVMQHPVTVLCAGRTDAGVHAIGQVVSFHSDNPMPLDRISWVTNRFLPATIRIRRVVEKTADFHARFSAAYRRYWYVVQTGGKPDPILGRYRWQIDRPLACEDMQRALAMILGRHDFDTFCHRGSPTGTTMRTLQRATVHQWQHGVIFDLQADAFLHQMVRLVIANTVLIGRGERPVDWLKELVVSCNRHLAGKGAPPHGLFLMRIGYPPTINPWWGSILEKLNNEELLG